MFKCFLMQRFFFSYEPDVALPEKIEAGSESGARLHMQEETVEALYSFLFTVKSLRALATFWLNACSLVFLSQWTECELLWQRKALC